MMNFATFMDSKMQKDLQYVFILICFLTTLSPSRSKDICKTCTCHQEFVSCVNLPLFNNLEHSRVLRIHIQNCDATSLFGSQLNFPKLSELHVKDSTLHDLNSNVLKLLSNLMEVEISNCSIKHLPTDLLSENCAKLMNLDFSDNHIDFLNSTSFACASKLRKIKLRGNNIEHLSKGTFSNNYLLKNLDLSRNNIKTIETGVFNISNVDIFFDPSSKVILNISNNELDVLGNNIFSLCSHLTILDMSHNSLVEIHQKTFVGLSSLQKLYLRYNNIQSLDSLAFRELTRLREIYLEKNFLKELGRSFMVSLPNLSYINVSCNHLSSLRSDVFQGCANLTTVDLSENTISVLEDCAFTGNSNLKELYLQGNSISNLSSCSVLGLSSLTTIHLENIMLENLDYTSFHYLEKLQNIYVSLAKDSKCKCVNSVIFKGKNITLFFDAINLNDECNELFDKYRSPDNGIQEECYSAEDSQTMVDCQCSRDILRTDSISVTSDSSINRGNADSTHSYTEYFSKRQYSLATEQTMLASIQVPVPSTTPNNYTHPVSENESSTLIPQFVIYIVISVVIVVGL